VSDHVFEAHKIRLSEVAPVACASCSGQYPDRRHVDFGSAFEGPMMPASTEVAGGKPVSVDDVVICDECLGFAAGLLGLVDPEEVRSANEKLVASNEELTERLAGALAYINKLETSQEARRTLEETLNPKPRRPRGAGGK
jgi:hypothetical protein